MKLEEILNKISKASVGETVKLVAVSKNVTTVEVNELFEQGQLDFGENRVQELKNKSKILSTLGINWHMIGRLQDNKINQLIAIRPTLWQSCDSFERAIAVNKRLDYRLDTLLQINSANEETKQGVGIDEAVEIYSKIKQNCQNINLIGIMSIGAHSDDISEIKKSFEMTRKIYDNLSNYGAKICSMGMSADFELAIKCGSNMVRLGSILYAN